MPYIINTRSTIGSGYPLAPGVTVGPDTTRAVATLEEARLAVLKAVEARRSIRVQPIADVVGAARWDGGTIGPLADGTLIDVEPVTYEQLAGLVFDRDDYAPMFEADILAAFNAENPEA